MFKKVNTMKNFLVSAVTICLSLVVLITTTTDASAQSTRQRLTAIEKQLNALQRAVFTPGSRFQTEDAANANNTVSQQASVPVGSEGAMIANVNIRISELETQLRQLTGQIEEMGFKVDTMNRKIETMEKDYEFRFLEIAGGGSVASVAAVGSAALPAASTPTPTMPLPDGTPKEQYDYAYSLVSSAEYENAEVSFKEFLRVHPQDDLAGNAQYWLGQTYYARGNYADATRTFLEGMSKYPESPKAPAYLLKVGMSLNHLGEKGEACEVYRELNARFPSSNENTNMRPAEERRAGCS